MLTELPKEAFVSLQTASSQLVFGFPAEPVQRGRVPHSLPARGHVPAGICLRSRAPLLSAPRRLPLPRTHAGTQTRSAWGDGGRRGQCLAGSGAASPSASASCHSAAGLGFLQRAF